jgi:hypothetical protein
MVGSASLSAADGRTTAWRWRPSPAPVMPCVWKLFETHEPTATVSIPHINALPNHECAHKTRYAPSDEYDPAMVVMHPSPTTSQGII